MVQKAVKEAAAQAAINKKVSCHTLRHSGVYPAKGGTTHLLEVRYDIRTVQELLGHANIDSISPQFFLRVNFFIIFKLRRKGENGKMVKRRGISIMFSASPLSPFLL